MAENSLILPGEQHGSENHPAHLKDEKEKRDKEKPGLGALGRLDEERQGEKGL